MSTETTLAAELAEDAAERLLRYARIDTRSDEESETYPSPKVSSSSCVSFVTSSSRSGSPT